MSRLSVIEEKFSFLADWSLSDERRSVSKDDCSIFDEITAIIERMIKDTVKESLSIQSKTELVWAFDTFIKKNAPQPITSTDITESIKRV